VGDLATLLGAEGIENILAFDFIPWGNAYINTSKCGLPAASGWASTGYNGAAKECWLEECVADESKCEPGGADSPMICQHGPNECLVDRYEACAINLTASNWSTYMPFVECFEGHAASRAVVGIETDAAVVHLAAELCAQNSRGSVEWTVLQACADNSSALGDALDKEMAQRTAKLKPEHEYTPWVTIDGLPQRFPDDDDDPFNPLNHLLEYVCGNYTGASQLPPGCTTPTPTPVPTPQAPWTASEGVFVAGMFGAAASGGAAAALVFSKRRQRSVDGQTTYGTAPLMNDDRSAPADGEQVGV
jgi:hypothetical protein